MKITAQEEYGLRILIRIARSEEGICISDISEAEGMTHHNAAKLCRVLRMEGYIESTKGHQGGYKLARSASEINLGELLHKLGGSLYCDNFCGRFLGDVEICTHSVDCSVRSLWKVLQGSMDSILNKLSLQDMIGKETEVSATLCQK